MRQRRTHALALLIASWVVLVPGTAAAQHLGLLGGLNRAGIQGDAPPNTKYAGATGFLAGLVVEFAVAPDVFVSLQPQYARRGTGIAFAVAGEEQPRDSLDVALTYVTLPVLAKVQALHGRTYVTGGVDVGMLLDATLSGRGPDEDIKTVLNDVDVAALFGFGVVFPLGAPRLTLELRYTQSLLNLSAGPGSVGRGGGTGPAGAALPDRFRASGFQLLAGMLVRLGGR